MQTNTSNIVAIPARHCSQREENVTSPRTSAIVQEEKYDCIFVNAVWDDLHFWLLASFIQSVKWQYICVGIPVKDPSHDLAINSIIIQNRFRKTKPNFCVFFHEELCHYFPPLKYMETKEAVKLKQRTFTSKRTSQSRRNRKEKEKVLYYNWFFHSSCSSHVLIICAWEFLHQITPAWETRRRRLHPLFPISNLSTSQAFSRCIFKPLHHLSAVVNGIFIHAYPFHMFKSDVTELWNNPNCALWQNSTARRQVRGKHKCYTSVEVGLAFY